MFPFERDMRANAAAAKRGASAETRNAARREKPSANTPAAIGRMAAPISCDTASEASIQPPARGRKTTCRRDRARGKHARKKSAADRTGERPPLPRQQRRQNVHGRGGEGSGGQGAEGHALAALKHDHVHGAARAEAREQKRAQPSVPPDSNPNTLSAYEEIHWFITTSEPYPKNTARSAKR